MKQIKDVTTSDIFSHWINIAYLPRWGVLLLDLFIVFVAFIISIIIGNNLWGYSFPSLLFPIWLQLLVLLITQCGFFWAFHTYSGILRYSTFVDTIKVTLAVVSSGASLLVVNLVCKKLLASTPFLTTSLIMYIFIAICFLFIWRVIIKTTFEYLSFHNTNVKKVLIYGTQSAGLSIAKMLQSNIESAYRPVGFIADDTDCSHHNLLGLDIYPYNQELIALMKQKGIKCVIVSPIKMKEINPLKDLAIFLNNDIQILTTPYFTDFSENAVEDNISKVIGRIESIKVEDLLERPVIDIDTENVEAILRHRIMPFKFQGLPLPLEPWLQPLESQGPPAGRGGSGGGTVRPPASPVSTDRRLRWTEPLWLRAEPRAPWLCARPAGVRPARGTAAQVI